MLSETELEILSALDEPMSIAALADALDRSESQVSRLVNSLGEKGIVEGRREGKSKIVRPLSYEPVNRYQDIVRKYPHIEFPPLLQGKAIPLLYYLGDEPMTVSELAEETGNYRNTVHRIIKRLQNRGIITQRAGSYVLNDDFIELHRFARSLITHFHIMNAPASGTILWENHNEVLLQTDEEIDDEEYIPTGPHRFSDFDIPLLTTDRRYYFYSGRTDDLTAADLVCHMLLIDDSARYKGYCLLLIEKEDIDEKILRERANHYSVEEAVKDLLDYLETRGESGPGDVVSWDEFQTMAEEYGVDV